MSDIDKRLEELVEGSSPAPWYFDDIKPYKLRTSKTNQSIAYVEPGVYVNNHGEQDGVNRCLMASAPALADALLRARKALRVAKGGCANCATCTNEVCCRLRNAALADSELEEALD